MVAMECSGSGFSQSTRRLWLTQKSWANCRLPILDSHTHGTCTSANSAGCSRARPICRLVWLYNTTDIPCTLPQPQPRGRRLERSTSWIFSLKEWSLIFKLVLDTFVIFNILLRSVDNSDDSKLYWNDSSAQNINGIGSSVHKIKFSDDSQSPSAFWIYILG